MRGRPPMGAEIVEHLSGSSQAKQRLAVILRTLAGEISVPQACQELGVGETRFHELRNETLQHALDDLEAKPRGRPPSAQEDARVAELQQQILTLKTDLRAAQIREELATMLPHVMHPQDKPAGDKKKPR
jgi:transposase